MSKIFFMVGVAVSMILLLQVFYWGIKEQFKPVKAIYIPYDQAYKTNPPGIPKGFKIINPELPPVKEQSK